MLFGCSSALVAQLSLGFVRHSSATCCRTTTTPTAITTTRMMRAFATSTSQNENNNNGIVSIAINNPKRRNALSTPVLESLLQQLTAAKNDASTRVVVIKAFDDDDEKYNNGVFCSGHDLNELTKQKRRGRGDDDDNTNNIGEEEKEEDKEAYQRRMQKLFSLCSTVMTELSTFPVPTIAQVDGIATAAGCQLVASCDLAIASETSRFSTPGVHIGLFCSTPAVPLVRTVAAKKHAMEMLLTGEMISAQRAYEIGLINRIVKLPTTSSDDNQHQKQQQHRLLSLLLKEQVQQFASTIASKSKPCLQTGLQTLRAQQVLSLPDAYAVAERTMVENLLSDDAVEGIDAFLTKRKPNWTTK